MIADLLQFLAAHGTAAIVAGTLLAAVGLVQWRRVRIAENELEFKERMLDRGMGLDELERLLTTHATPRRGMLEQFGALSGGTRAGIILAGTISLIVTVSVVSASIQSFAFWQVRQQPAYRPTAAPGGEQQPRLTLMPERPTIHVDESGSAMCRVHLVDGYVVYDLQIVAAIREQDNPASELRVHVTPATVPKTEAAAGRRYCDVQLQSVRGSGRFTILVTAADPYRQQAQTTFEVVVGKLEATQSARRQDTAVR